MARRKTSYDEPTESEPMPEDAPQDVSMEHKVATIQVQRHMVLAEGKDADWHPVAVQVSADVSANDPSSYENFEARSDDVEGITLNDEEMDLAFQALGIEPVGDTMTEEEHDAALAEEDAEEEV